MCLHCNSRAGLFSGEMCVLFKSSRSLIVYQGNVAVQCILLQCIILECSALVKPSETVQSGLANRQQVGQGGRLLIAQLIRFVFLILIC